jgi:hypothetical protein
MTALICGGAIGLFRAAALNLPPCHLFWIWLPSHPPPPSAPQVFEALDLPHIVALVRAVLLERQILLVSSQLSLLTATAEVVGALIYPFRWCHTAIPVMPKGMVEVRKAGV